MKTLKIRVKPGYVADLGGGRTSSSRKGGTYDAIIETEPQEFKLRHSKGIEILAESEAEAGPKPESTPKKKSAPKAAAPKSGT